MRAVGFNLGQRGDLVMNTVAARSFKELHPNSELVFAIYKGFADMEPLFRNHPNIDDVHIFDSYNDYPNEADCDYLENGGFDRIFHGMPQHKYYDWYNRVENQTAEACIMNGLPVPSDLQCELSSDFSSRPGSSDYVCIAPFSADKRKNLSVAKCVDIVWMVSKQLGLETYILSGPGQPQVDGCFIPRSGDYCDNVRLMLESQLLITVNTGMNWVASAFSHPTLGIMGVDNWAYHGLGSSRVYQPVNPRATYLEYPLADHVSVETIKENLIKILAR